LKFYCIADEDTVRGFRLAGVEGRVATSPQEATAALTFAAAHAEYGVVILTHQAAALVPAQVEAMRLQHDRPLLVEIPSPGGAPAEGKSLRQLALSAVGMNVETGKELK
jgi:V/A-type H+-transporting ATPase subunit F